MAQAIPTRNGACAWSAPSTCDRAAGAAQGTDVHCFDRQVRERRGQVLYLELSQGNTSFVLQVPAAPLRSFVILLCCWNCALLRDARFVIPQVSHGELPHVLMARRCRRNSWRFHVRHVGAPHPRSGSASYQNAILFRTANLLRAFDEASLFDLDVADKALKAHARNFATIANLLQSGIVFIDSPSPSSISKTKIIQVGSRQCDGDVHGYLSGVDHDRAGRASDYMPVSLCFAVRAGCASIQFRARSRAS
jgi:hypothetical protein